jgi:hypothetical protein
LWAVLLAALAASSCQGTYYRTMEANGFIEAMQKP